MRVFYDVNRKENSMQLIIKNGIMADPKSGIYESRNILIRDGLIVDNDLGEHEVEAFEKLNTSGGKAEYEVIDATGLHVMPGLIDMHVHFRDPGQTEKEDIISGSKAAAAGGYTCVCPMPNTNPPIDNAQMIKYEYEKAQAAGFTNVLPVGAITRGQEGTEIADIYGMKNAGAIAISEDGKSVMDVRLCREAFKRAAKNNMLIVDHCEDKNLVDGGVMNAGKKAEELGLKGISNAVEDIIAARDIMLAGETGAKLHLCHCSTEASVELVRMAKKLGYKVTAEVCPHHFALTEDEIPGDDAMYKMNPPLRSRQDVMALVKGLADGTMDVISTDHAPHTLEEKSRGFNNSPFGIVGLETSFAVSFTTLVKTRRMSLLQLLEKMSLNPSKILGLDRGSLENGSVADIFIADLSHDYMINFNNFYSKGKNTPFAGRRVFGEVKYTLLAGKQVFPFA